MILKFVTAIFSSFFVSWVLTPITRNFFIAKGWVENPEKKQLKTHNATATASVPRGGGIPIFFGITFSALLFLPPDKHLVFILLSSILTLIVGVFDDIKDVNPKTRLLTNIVAALLVVSSGIGIAYISNPLGGIIDLSTLKINFDLLGPHSIWVISDLLAVFWIVWCMNSVGWAAGVEGQLPGFAGISAIFIGILGLRYATDVTQWPVIILAGAVAGAYLGFLPYNFYPQSIMPGYSGKSLAGLLLAVLSILSGAKLATLIFLLGIPMLDGLYVLTKRIIDHRPIFVSDGSHFHHRLLRLGWSRRKISVFYWAISLLLGIISLFLNSQQKMYVFVGVALLFFGSLIQLSRRT
ncbi:MAG: MraY family glycosyltransferase [Candidatus Shapirobacteria bacterium]|jgi:UDP-GlcNAc:undecaprenyl-phosphate GlcNAc-1-phosphate transferase